MLLGLINGFYLLSAIAGVIVLGLIFQALKYNRIGFASLALFLILDTGLNINEAGLLNNLYQPLTQWPLLLSAINCLYPLLLLHYMKSITGQGAHRTRYSLWLAPVFFLLAFIVLSVSKEAASIHQLMFKDSFGPYIFYGSISSIYCCVMLAPLTQIKSEASYVKYFTWGISFIVLTYAGNTLSFLILASLSADNQTLLVLKFFLLFAWFGSIFYLMFAAIYFLPFNASEKENKISEEDTEVVTASCNHDEASAQGFEQSQALQVLAQFEKLLEEKKLFMDSRLQIADVSEMLGITDRALRIILQQKKNDSFKNLINAKRVDYVKQRINNAAEKPNFLDIAYEAGFNSKATFNRVFKQTTNLSPTEYFSQIS